MKLTSKTSTAKAVNAQWCPCEGGCFNSCKSGCYGCKGNCANICTGCSISASY